MRFTTLKPLRRQRARSRAGAERTRRRYDAFVSYSRAVDGRLAPALQQALQRFAKPWYRLRALRVFRDDTSLSTNSALWASIRNALDSSEFFVLLASPDAAASEWVTREVGYWREHRRHDRVLIVLTDGAIVWDDAAGDFALPESALPPTITGMFSEEPRWTDLRWARAREHVASRDPRFRSAVADIASALHGRPKDELLGEDIRQHRRSIRLAASAALLLAALAVAAALAAVYAVRQRNEARSERDVATSRYLASQALQYADDQLPRALLLAIEAVHKADTAEARGALLTLLERQPSELAAVLEGSSDDVAFDADGRTLVSAGGKGGIVLWDARTHRQLAALIGKGRSFAESVAVDVRGTLAAVGGLHGTIAFWNLRTKHQLGTILHSHDGRPVDQVEFSPDGSMLASGGEDGTIVLWDVHSHTPVGVMKTRHSIFRIAFSQDGAHLATVGPGPKYGVHLWDVRTKRELAMLPSPKDFVNDVAFSPRDGKLATAGDKGRIGLWNARTHRRVAFLPMPHREPVQRVAFNRDGTTLAAGGLDGTVALWDMRRRPRRTAVFSTKGAWVNGLAFSGDGRTLASSNQDGAIRLWILDRRLPLGTPLGSGTSGDSATISRDGALLASAYLSNYFSIFAGRDADLHRKKQTIVLWNTRARKRLGTLETDRDATMKAIASSPDGRTVAGAEDDGAIFLWDVSTRTPRGRYLSGWGSLTSVVFSPDNATVACGCDRDVVLWEVPTHHRLAVLRNPEAVDDVAFSPDGSLVAAGIYNGTVALWNLSTRRRGAATLRSSPSPGDSATPPSVMSIAFSGHRSMLAAARTDGTIDLWDIRTRRQLGAPLAHRPTHVVAVVPIDRVAFSPDGNVLAAAAEDGTLSLWDVRTHTRIGEPLKIGVPLLSLAFLPGTDILVTGRADDKVAFVDAGPSSWERDACALASRNLSMSEWSQFVGSPNSYRRTCPGFPPNDSAG